MRQAYAMLGMLFILLIIGIVFATQGTQERTATITQSNEGQSMVNLQLTSTAFEHEGAIPSQYTCDAENISPALSVSGVPEGAQSLALIMHDPDAPREGGFTHWVRFNISPTLTEIPEGIEPAGMPGANSRGDGTYTGPCPPDGEHRYYFMLYALDADLDLPEGATKGEVEAAMEGHIIDETELMGRYKRQ